MLYDGWLNQNITGTHPQSISNISQYQYQYFVFNQLFLKNDNKLTLYLNITNTGNNY